MNSPTTGNKTLETRANRKHDVRDGVQRSSSHRQNLLATVIKYNMGLKLLPDVKDFQIKLGEKDQLFHSIGVNLNETPELRFEPWKNRRINRQVVRQYERMERARGNPELFWRIAWSLMRMSSYQVMMANKGNLEGWHRNLPYWKVLKIMNEVKELVRTRATNIDYHRTYIPKGETYRPLGVPTPAWNIYLSMYANIVRFWLRDSISGCQHGYIPGRGVVTAWQSIIQHVIPSPDIYEFDLKQFFPSVDTGFISEKLLESKLPIAELYYLQDMFKAQPKLPPIGEQLLDERIAKRKAEIASASEEHVPTNPLESWRAFEFDPTGGTPDNPYPNQEIANMLLAEEAVENGLHPDNIHGPLRNLLIQKVVEMQWAMLSSFKPASTESFKEFTEGVPQGTPISPILSILALEGTIIGPERSTLMYADDGVIYGNKLKDDPFPKGDQVTRANIARNDKKSGWVRKGGEWKTTLKFLGMEYDPQSNEFRAHTRNGATLVFSDEVKFVLWLKENKNSGELPHSVKITRKQSLETLLRDYWKEYVDNHSWEELFKSRFIGFIFSRMQSDNWSNEVHQDFSLTFEKNSWQDIHSVGFLRRKCTDELMTIFNSSTFANHCLWSDLQHNRCYSHRKDYILGLKFVRQRLRKLWNNW